MLQRCEKHAREWMSTIIPLEGHLGKIQAYALEVFITCKIFEHGYDDAMTVLWLLQKEVTA